MAPDYQPGRSARHLAGKPVGLEVVGTDRRATVRLPAQLPALRLGQLGEALDLYDAVLLPPDAVPPALREPQRLALGADGKQSTIEVVRNATWDSTPAALLTPAENAARDPQGAMIAGYRVAALAGVLFVLLVATLSLVVSTVDGVLQQRRHIAGLLALGVPARVLRRAALLQTVIPLLLNLALAAATGVMTGAMYVRLDDLHTSLPWRDWSLLSGATLVVVVLVSALALPFLRTAARPGALRTE